MRDYVCASTLAQRGGPGSASILTFLLAHALHQAGRQEDANLADQQALRLSNDVDQAQQRAAHLGAR